MCQSGFFLLNNLTNQNNRTFIKSRKLKPLQTLVSSYKNQFQTSLTFQKSVLKAYKYQDARYYDSDVARFLSLDPLANKFPAWSAYNYVVGNPIAFTDPDGREATDIIIRNVYKDSKGNTKTFSVEYKNGKLYTESGKLYKPLKGGYIETVRDQLNTIKGESERGKNVISTLENSNNNHIITNNDYVRPEHKDIGNYNLETTVGSTITKYDAKNRFTVAGNERNPRVGLIHELTHAYDQDRGANHYFTTKIGGVKLCEIHAVNVENTVRSKTGDPKRTDYGGVSIPKLYLH